MNSNEIQNNTNSSQQNYAPQNNTPVQPYPMSSYPLQVPRIDLSSFQCFNNLPDNYPLPFPMNINNYYCKYNPKPYFHEKPKHDIPKHDIPNKNPADFFIDSINSTIAPPSAYTADNNGIEQNGIKCIKKEADWIGGALSEEMKSWQNYHYINHNTPFFEEPSIINAPPGYGKTTFVFRELREKASQQNYCILLVVNRSILKGQISRLIREELGGYTTGAPEDSLSVYGNIILCTYQYFLKDFRQIVDDFQNHIPSQNLGYIVMDEVHYFISDSAFGGATHEVLRNILRLSYRCFDEHLLCKVNYPDVEFKHSFPPIKRIYMTATPDYVRDVIVYEEKCAQEIRKVLLEIFPHVKSFFSGSGKWFYNYIEEFDFPVKESKKNIKPVFYFNQEYIIQQIAKSDKNERWLVFINDVKAGQELCKYIQEALGISSEFIWADSASDNIRNELEVKQRFDCRVLIATSVLDNGVSIIDDTLKNIVVDTTDKVQLIQMLGRKRLADDEPVNLYVTNKSETDIVSYIRSNDECLRNINASYGDVRTFENNLISDGFSGRELFKYSPAFGKHIASDYTKYYIKRRGDELVRLKSELSRDKDAFAKLVCSWLNIDFNNSMIANDMKYIGIWADIEKILSDIIKDYLECNSIDESEFETATLKDNVVRFQDKAIISKKSLDSVVDKMLDAIKLIKYRSGIRTEEGRCLYNANQILNFFALNGFDHYKFEGKSDKDTNKLAYRLQYVDDDET